MATRLRATLLVTLTFLLVVRGQNSRLTFRINEEEDAGTFVGSVADANLNGTSIRYYFVPTTQTDFSLNDSNGALYTMTKIDRDTKCKEFQASANDECVIELLVGAEHGTVYTTIDVRVIIMDINDNAPLFPAYTHELRIVEGTPSGTEFSIPRAVDLDFGTNGIVKYEINPSNPKFNIRAEKNLAGQFEVFIVVLDNLDRENKDSYSLEVSAIDGGGKQGIMTVNVVVTDINDNEPIFDRKNYTKQVDEGTAQGTVILTLNATDKDSGENGLITYGISEGFTLTDFVLDPNTGEIKVATDELVYHPDKNYAFIAEAYDNGQNRKRKQVWVYITILDTGNNYPQITVNVGNSGFVNVSEARGLKQKVADVTVEDPDTGPNGEVTCSTQDGYFAVTKITDAQFIVIVNSALDREIKDLHTVNVTCTDKGDPALSSSKTFVVRVTDENDNKPQFEMASYDAKIPEHTKETQILMKVSATDRDIGANSRIHYAIVDNDKITIDPVTGVVSAKPFFDRESTPVIVFTVLAIDSGVKPLTGTATVTLTIDDINDNAPEFVQSSYSLEVLENMPSGTYVDQLSATDRDTGPNAVFSFSLSPNYVDRRLPFTIFENGEIQTNTALNREERSMYEFDAVVRDHGQPPLESSVRVTITVKDVNDNTPNITFPVPLNRSVTIYYPNSELEMVTKIQAYDIDQGVNGVLQYEIFGGNDLGLFKIDPWTGVITIAKHDVKIDSNLEIMLTVRVSDQGKPSLIATEDLIVNVIYSNATYEDLSAEKDKLVVIVVVVVLVTVICSAIIITVILLLRKWDRKKNLPEAVADKPKTVENNYQNLGKSSLFILNNAGESSSDYPGPYGEMKGKKKEVSFSLDEHDSVHNYQTSELRVNMSPEPEKYSPEKVCFIYLS